MLILLISSDEGAKPRETEFANHKGLRVQCALPTQQSINVITFRPRHEASKIMLHRSGLITIDLN